MIEPEDLRGRLIFERKIFEGLLYLASEKGSTPFPSIETYLISSIVAGTYEYVTGQEFQKGHTECEGFNEDPWIHRTNKGLEVLNGQRKFNSTLAEAIRSWTQIRRIYDHGESWWESKIRYWLMFSRHNRMQSTFALTVPQAREIEKDLETLDPDTLRHMTNIAEIMKKYIKRDLEFINKHYQW